MLPAFGTEQALAGDGDLASFAIRELAILYDAHYAAGKAFQALLNQPRCGADFAPVDRWYQHHFAVVDAIGKEAELRRPTSDDDIRDRQHLLMRHYAIVDDLNAEARLAGEILAHHAASRRMA
jgi:hypothetical protein